MATKRLPQVVPTRTAYTLAEIGELLHVSIPTLYNAINDGRLRTFKIGRTRRISAAALSEFIKQSERRAA